MKFISEVIDKLKYATILAAVVFCTPLAVEAIPDKHERCLASAVYHEARGEPIKAQRAVLDVVIHRAVNSGQNFCQVVSKKDQFSWYKHHGIKKYNDSQKTLLYTALSQKRVLKQDYEYFYSGKKPKWARNMSCKPIGHLTFCKESV